MYAFADAPAAIPAVRGIDSAPLETYGAEGVDAVASRHESAAIEASEPAILAHARVVEALTATNDAVLPARFGGAYTDPEALRTVVGERAGELGKGLDRVRGCVELGLRAVGPARDAVAASSGAGYMRARLAERREIERRADELHHPLAALAREATRAVGATERLLLSAEYLVPKRDVPAFRELVERLQADHPELGIVCTGPWPPYSFATAGSAA